MSEPPTRAELAALRALKAAPAGAFPNRGLDGSLLHQELRYHLRPSQRLFEIGEMGAPSRM